VPDMSASDFPELGEIADRMERFATSHQEISRVVSLGTSEEGREIAAVEVTAPTVAAEKKECAVVLCGRHGNELGTRVVGTALLSWLASREAARVRNCQRTLVVPVANPDGCARGEFFAPSDGLSETERAILRQLEGAYQPDLIVDVHSLGDGDLEAIIAANPRGVAEDHFIHSTLAREAAAAACKAGYPFALEWMPDRPTYNNFFCEACYERSHSLVFGLEVNHWMLGPEQAGQSGVAAIKALLNSAARRFPWEAQTGYPNKLLAGRFEASLRAAGDVAAQRRESAALLWRNRARFGPIARETPDPGVVRVWTDYTGEDLPCQLSLSCRLRGRDLRPRLWLNGTEVNCRSCEDECSTYVFADAEVRAGNTYELVARVRVSRA
jgi:hypothetical protein